MNYYDLLIKNIGLYFIIVVITIVIIIVVLNYMKNKRTIETYVGNLKVATDLDKKRASKYALQQMCQKNGYVWVQGGDEFIYDCKHSKTTCERDSIYPTKDDAIPQYYEWRDADSEEGQEAAKLGQEFSTGRLLSSYMRQSANISNASDILNKDIGGICILGNEPMRSMCESEKLRYDKTTGKCFTTKEYCYSKLLAYCNGDCFEPPYTYITVKVLGKTVGKAVGQASWMYQLIKYTCPQ